MCSLKPSGMQNGEEGRKKKRTTGAGTLTPIILPDTSLSFHILGLDLFQEFSSESLRTLIKAQRTVRYCKRLGVLKHSTNLAE